MNKLEKCAWANAYQNQDFICIHTCSGYSVCARDPQGKESLLGVDADDTALGTAVLEALAQSRFLSINEVRQFLDFRLIEQRHEEWTKTLMERYGYKSKAAMFKKMKLCNIESSKGTIKLAPNRHDNLEGWGREKDDGIEDVFIADNKSPAEVGAALRLAFSRCVD